MSVTLVFEENISIKLQFTSYSTEIILHNALFLHPDNTLNVAIVIMIVLVRGVIHYLCLWKTVLCYGCM